MNNDDNDNPLLSVKILHMMQNVSFYGLLYHLQIGTQLIYRLDNIIGQCWPITDIGVYF